MQAKHVVMIPLANANDSVEWALMETRKIPITPAPTGAELLRLSKDVKIERVADVDGRATASLSRSSYVLY